MYYLLFYKVAENYLEKRVPFRSDHFEHVNSFVEKDMVLLAGAYEDPSDGALLIFNVDDPKMIEEFAANDPYTLNGVVTGWVIRKWNVVLGANIQSE